VTGMNTLAQTANASPAPATTGWSRFLSLGLLFVLAAGGTGCKSASNAFWGAMGYEKRDLLVSDVKKARDAQNDAKVQIQTTMQRFKEVTGFQGGELEAKYEKLKSAYETASARADKVSGRIGDVDKTANSLFAEWEKELGQYSDPALKRQSEQKLGETKQRYQQLVGVMRAAEAKMQPVLKVFNDHVLSLKHNLNAAAIASLQGTAAGIEQDVSRLIADMEQSINEANAFIAEIEKK
jgi:chromosome segregation ATPase